MAGRFTSDGPAATHSCSMRKIADRRVLLSRSKVAQRHEKKHEAWLPYDAALSWRGRSPSTVFGRPTAAPAQRRQLLVSPGPRAVADRRSAFQPEDPPT